MAKPLVIVESPAKARTIAGFLGKDFVVEASIGNIRDLPRNAAEIPAQYKGLAWASLGVDVEHGFKPIYVVPSEKKQQVTKLKQALKSASEVYLATDEDREGESIAWHLMEVLKPKVPVRRMVFHEISRSAINKAVRESRELDRRLVDAQETRRILDRLYGYEVSPVLWKKIMPGLSAGRVQSVFTRIVVEREWARMRFRPASWWDLEAEFEAPGGSFSGRLAAVGGVRLAGGKDFSETGELLRDDVVRLDEEQARALAERLSAASFEVRRVDQKPYRQSPHAPFMTSTLQQEAGRKLRFGSRQTMQVAQRLYENGYITYMRTDSTELSETAVQAARAQAAQMYGPEYVPDKPRTYARKTKNAQEAHEAIRPGGDEFRTPEQVASLVAPDEARLYELIWKRTLASQMSDAVGSSVHVRIAAVPEAGEEAEFAASGRTITFPGFLRAYVQGSDDPQAELEDRQVRLPPLEQGMALDCSGVSASGHTTQPPPRYTEPALVRAVEELGVGRPSTYASMIGTIQDRGYVWKKGQALVPSWTAFAVITLLERHFGDLVDYAFTARMEDALDEIASGTEQATPWLNRFYFGNGQPGLKTLVTERLGDIDAREVNSIRLGEDEAGTPVVVRVGRWGPYVQRGDDTARLPDDLAPDELGVSKAIELMEAPKGDTLLGTDPDTTLPVYLRTGRFGPYVQLGEAEGAEKPRTSSLFKTMDPESFSLEQALRLLQIPRVLGSDPSDGEQIVALNGRHGPYLKKGTDSRSLDDEERLLSVTLDEALALFAQPKERRGRGQPRPPLKELGPDPLSGKPVVVKEGRFGPYVTDGETNASLQRDDNVETVTIERAAELLQARRERGPVTRKRPATKRAAPKKKKKPGDK
ncbi:MAG TPA: type I DNA topoisomerase [Actinomycetota bacterium]|nr:type I DNA topoisomerase [Actinomycetota bacterium]